MALMAAWLRLSTMRQLDWYRNANYQGKDIAHVQKQLAQRMADKVPARVLFAGSAPGVGHVQWQGRAIWAGEGGAKASPPLRLRGCRCWACVHWSRTAGEHACSQAEHRERLGK